MSCERVCMATEDNEYFSDILDTLIEYQDRRGQRLCSKKLKEAVRRIINEEEEEIERNISDSKERVDAISDSKEGVDDISDSKEGVDGINDSKEQVDARNWLRKNSFGQVDVLNDSKNLVVDGSDPKSDPSLATHTTKGIFS